MRGINEEVIRFTKYQLTQGVKTIWYVFYVSTEFLLTGGVNVSCLVSCFNKNYTGNCMEHIPGILYCS